MTGSTAPLLALLLLLPSAFAHIELVFPPGINSKFNPATPEPSRDYSMTSPLASDGSNWPCKGYNTAANIAAIASVATLTAGSSFDVKLGGSATHMGGSCQFAVSYDQGTTFAVVASIIGGCPISMAYSIPLPSLPSATKALFAWSWQNKEGNREDYGNCAIVDIVGTGPGTTYTGPKLFRANAVPDGTCRTLGGQEVVYPNPGPYVQYGGSQSSSSPATVLTPCSVDQSENVTIGPSGSQAAAPAAPRAPSPSPPASNPKSLAAPVVVATPDIVAAPVAAAPVVVAAAPAVVAAAPAVVVSAIAALPSPVASPSAASESPAASPFPSSDSTLASSPAPSPSPYSDSTPAVAPIATVVPAPVAPAPVVPVAPVAPVAPVVPVTVAPVTPIAPVAAPAQLAPVQLPPPSSEGAAYLLCTSLTTFSLCGSGICTPMGNVAAGTICKDGAIAMAPSRRMNKRSHWKVGMMRRGH